MRAQAPALRQSLLTSTATAVTAILLATLPLPSGLGDLGHAKKAYAAGGGGGGSGGEIGRAHV